MGRPALNSPAFTSPGPEELDRATVMLQAIADRTRLSILVLLLQHGELPVSDLAARLERPLPAVSQHLAKLKTGHLVVARRDGTSIRYRLSGEHVASLIENLLQHTEHLLFEDPPHHRTG